jgi:hypothetical protein
MSKKIQDDFDLTSLIANKKKRKNSILNEHFNTTEFMRSPGSGAFSTTHNLPEHLKFSGDLITPKNFRFIIECKKGYNKENLGSTFNTKSDLLNFIQQADRDARKIQKQFLIVFQQDRKDMLCIFSKNTNLMLADKAALIDNLLLTIGVETYVMCRLPELLSITRKFNCDHLWL